MALIRSSLAKKYVMAITGFLLLIFVFVHMLGNLQIFLGPAQLNSYAEFLQNTPSLLWASRSGLLILVLLHIWAATSLTLANRAARPMAYEERRVVAATYASRTMLMSGIIIAVFVVYHLLHFTVQIEAVNLTGQDFVELSDQDGRHDVYGMMVIGFSNLWVSGFYILGMALLGLHLSHGISSMFQSMGWKAGRCNWWLDGIARVTAVVIFLGYISIPLAILAGLIE